MEQACAVALVTRWGRSQTLYVVRRRLVTRGGVTPWQLAMQARPARAMAATVEILAWTPGGTVQRLPKAISMAVERAVPAASQWRPGRGY
jgi:hypothetical protein